MGNIIKTRLIKIGNSQGIRIPKMLLDHIALTEELELAVQGDHLVLRPTRRPRAGWDAQFRQMAANSHDQLLDPESGALSTWDEEEWVWE